MITERKPATKRLRGGGAIVLPLLWLASWACSSPAERAAEELERVGLAANVASFRASVRDGQAHLVPLFLEAGLEPDTAMVTAASNGHTEIVQSLLAAGADPSSFQAAIATALAERAGQTACARLLREAGAGPDVRNAEGETALMDAVRRGRRPVIEALLATGAEVDAATNSGRTALMLAVQAAPSHRRYWPLIRLLLDANADVNAADRDGWTALTITARTGQARLVRRLVKRSADVDAMSQLGWTPLMFAAWEGNAGVVEALLKAGADVNLATKAGKTALIRAAQNGNRQTVGALLRAGADPRIEIDGLDARCAAKLRDDPEMIDAIESAYEALEARPAAVLESMPSGWRPRPTKPAVSESDR